MANETNVIIGDKQARVVTQVDENGNVVPGGSSFDLVGGGSDIKNGNVSSSSFSLEIQEGDTGGILLTTQENCWVKVRELIIKPVNNSLGNEITIKTALRRNETLDGTPTDKRIINRRIGDATFITLQTTSTGETLPSEVKEDVITSNTPAIVFGGDYLDFYLDANDNIKFTVDVSTGTGADDVIITAVVDVIKDTEVV